MLDEGEAHRQRPPRYAVVEIGQLDRPQLWGKRMRSVGVFEAVDRGDVGMIEGGEHLRLALEARADPDHSRRPPAAA